MDVIQGTKVLCPHDAEEVETILRRVRRSGAATNCPQLALMRGRKSFRLHQKTFTDNRRRCFVGVREREVVGGVVGKSDQFGGLKTSKTAEQQSEQHSENESDAHFKVRRQGSLIQHTGSQLNGSELPVSLSRVTRARAVALNSSQ
jgi:hypothetical protein